MLIQKTILTLAFIILGSIGWTQDVATRPVKTILVAPASESVVRRYPAILAPKEVVDLAFEIGGALGLVDVEIGQAVAEGAVLVSLNQEALVIAVTQAEASLQEAKAANANAQSNLDREAQLFERGTIAQAALDTAITQADQAMARQAAAEAGLETAQRNLSLSTLKAPFDGTISSVEVSSFGNISPGRVVLTMFPNNGFEINLLVSFDVLGNLTLGMPAKIRPADRPDEILVGTISEIGQRAEAVSSFPVTVALTEAPTFLRAGMAVEVALDLPIEAQQTFAIPVASLALSNLKDLQPPDPEGDGRMAEVFVFDPDTSTVRLREIAVAGISGSNLIVTGGLDAGERIVAAGAALLFDGQAVTLWQGQD